MKNKRRNIAFWIIAVLCIISIILSPVLAYIKKDVIVGGYMLGVSILLWLCLAIIDETGKHNNNNTKGSDIY